jgi:hypothetical protein
MILPVSPGPVRRAWAGRSLLVQARALKNGIVIMGFSRAQGLNREGTKAEDHIALAPAFNVTKDDIEMMIDILIQSVEELQPATANANLTKSDSGSDVHITLLIMLETVPLISLA